MARSPVLELVVKAKDVASGTLRQVGASVKSLGGTMEAVTRSAAGLFAVFGAGLSARSFIDINVEFERLRAQLRAFARDESDAAAQFQMLRDFAVETPFELRDLTAAWIQLRAAGLRPSVAEFKALGDVASAVGKPIEQLGEAIRSAAGGSVERLNQFGIVARVAGDKIIVSFQGQTETIDRTTLAVQQYLVKLAASAGWTGAMERQVQTLGGALSNLSDAFANLTTTIGENTTFLGRWIRDFTAGLDGISIRWKALFGGTSETRDLERLLEIEKEIAALRKAGVSFSTGRATSPAARIAQLEGEREMIDTARARRIAEQGQNQTKDEAERRAAEARAKATAAKAQADADAAAERERWRRGAAGLRTFTGQGGGPRVTIPGVDGMNLGAPGAIGDPNAEAAKLTREFAMTNEQVIDLTRNLDEIARSLSDLDDITSSIGDGFRVFGSAVSAAFAAMVDGSMAAGYAFEVAIKQGVAQAAQTKASYYFAESAAAFASGILGDPRGFAAGAQYLAAATGMAAIGGAVQGSVNRAARGVGGVGGGAFGVVPTARGMVGIGDMETTVVIRGGLLDMSSPTQADALARALQTLSGRKVRVEVTA